MNKTQHDGDCAIYSDLINDRYGDGICNCGYGLELARNGDRSELYSKDVQTMMKIFPPRPEALKEHKP